MKGIDVCRLAVKSGPHMFRQRKDAAGHDYDVKPWGTGNKRGWTMLDSFSASAVVAVYDGLRPENQAKFERFNLVAMVKLAFKLVK